MAIVIFVLAFVFMNFQVLCCLNFEKFCKLLVSVSFTFSSCLMTDVTGFEF